MSPLCRARIRLRTPAAEAACQKVGQLAGVQLCALAHCHRSMLCLARGSSCAFICARPQPGRLSKGRPVAGVQLCAEAHRHRFVFVIFFYPLLDPFRPLPQPAHGTAATRLTADRHPPGDLPQVCRAAKCQELAFARVAEALRRGGHEPIVGHVIRASPDLPIHSSSMFETTRVVFMSVCRLNLIAGGELAGLRFGAVV